MMGDLVDLLAEAQRYSLRAAPSTDEHERAGRERAKLTEHERAGLTEAVYDALSEPGVLELADAEAPGAFLRFREYVAAGRSRDAAELAAVLIPLLINRATSEGVR
jgi:hypothetical protein